MAVEANVRKRKHSQNDDGANVVPTKLHKKSKTPKKKTVNETVVKNGNEDEYSNSSVNANSPKPENQKQEDINYAEKEKPITFSNEFKMLNFRTKLRGTNFITELRHFLHLSDRKPRFIAKYIEKRGKPLELAEALERIDKTNLLHIGYICQALQAVLMEIVSNQQAHMESAVSSSRYFLKVHSGVVEQLLESAQIQHRRIALKLLTAIVCVDPQMGRQVLTAFNVLSDVRKIEQFNSHSKFELHATESVRKCYIHFVLSFLVDGNTLLVQNILDRGSLIQALTFGMLYDDHITVCLVLKTLKKYVLESGNITKTKKIHIFDVECCKNLVRLFDWLGPKVYAAKFSGKNSNNVEGERLTYEQISGLIDQKEKENVCVALYEFLTTLLTSRKHGITFDALTHFRQRHNVIQGKVIGIIFKPWRDDLKKQLIIKILEACPELARNTMRHLCTVITLQKLGEKEWPQAAHFMCQIIETLHPRLLRNALLQLTLTDLAFWIKDICLPLDTLLSMNNAKVLMNVNFDCRLAAHRLLLAMFQQYTNFMNAAMQREQKKGGGSTLRRFKFDLYSHIITNFPAVDHILRSLHITTDSANMIDPQLILSHFNVTLDLILAICKQNASFVNKTGTVVDYLNLIRPLYSGEVDDEGIDYPENNTNDDKNEDNNHKDSNTMDKTVIKKSSRSNIFAALANHGDIQLELKAVKTILLLSPSAVQPTEEIFPKVLKSFVKGFVYGNQQVQREAGDLLRDIFWNTGIFNAGPLEIDIWLEVLRFVQPDAVDVATQVFVEVLKVTQVEVELPGNIEDDDGSNISNLTKLFENIEKGHSVQPYMESFAISKLLPLIYKGVDIDNPFDKYLELVCFLLYHYHPKPSYVIKLYEMNFEKQIEYMSSWLGATATDDNLKSKFPKIADHIPKLKQLHQTIINDEANITFDFLFGASSEQTDEATFQIELHGEQMKLTTLLQNERLLMIYMQQIIFLITQLLSKQQLKHSQVELAVNYMNNFLKIMHQIELESNTESLSYTDDGDVIAKRTFLNTFLCYVFDVRLSCVNSAELAMNNGSVSNANFLHFLSQMAKQCSALPDFDDIVRNFRLKIVRAAAIAIESLETSATSETTVNGNAAFIEMIEAFELNAENCTEILELLCKRVNYQHYFTKRNDGEAVYQRTFYYDLLICVLRRLATIAMAVDCEQQMKTIAKLYVKFQHEFGTELNLEEFEDVLHDFLCVVHQYIPIVSSKIFKSIFVAAKITKSSVKLATLLYARHAELGELFLELLPAQIDKRELIYPLLEIAFEQHLPIDVTLLSVIYHTYRNGFMKSIEKPQKAGVIYKEHAACSVALVAQCMPDTECMDFCKKRLQFNDASEIYQLRLIDAIYEKAYKAIESHDATDCGKMLANFLTLLLQMLSADLKRQTLTVDKLSYFAFYIQNWCRKIKPEMVPHIRSVYESQIWLNFCKNALKQGMQGDANEAITMLYGSLLELVAFLTEKFHPDVENIAVEGESGTAVTGQLFEMICTHSKYYEVVLAAKPNKLKTEILHLLYVLGKNCASTALAQLEIPVILAAYHAKLSAADRYALALLQLFELHHTAAIQKFRPFVWGESAISFYEINFGEKNERTKLTQQETAVTLVMSLIERNHCEFTIEHFPIWRKLNAMEQLPAVDFVNPNEMFLNSFGTNSLEHDIESKWFATSNPNLQLSICNNIDPRLYPESEETFKQCYDPAFFVPLMSSLFAPESVVHAAHPVKNGLLAMCFGALSSQDKEMRQAAGLVQLRYRTHFEQRKFYEKPLWVQAYNNIQAGLAELTEAWFSKHKNHSKEYVPVPRVPYIPALFIAKTFNITNDPTSLLYKQLTMYLRLKSSFNFQCVPEFNVFFHSTEVEHHTYRQFIIEVIRQGVRCSTDLFLLISTNTFKVILGFYGGTMSNLETNLLILSLLSTCVKIPACAKIMVEHVGILPWLTTVIGTLEFYHFDVIAKVIDMISNLWYAITAASPEFYNYKFIAFKLHHLILKVVPLISARINLVALSKALNIMQKTAKISKTNAPYVAMSSEQLDKLISCSEKHFGSLVKPLSNLKILGSSGAGSQEEYCKALREQNVDADSIVALSSLRVYIVEWSEYQKSQGERVHGEQCAS